MDAVSGQPQALGQPCSGGNAPVTLRPAPQWTTRAYPVAHFRTVPRHVRRMRRRVSQIMIIEHMVGELEVFSYPSRLFRRHRIQDQVGHDPAAARVTGEFQQLGRTSDFAGLSGLS